MHRSQNSRWFRESMLCVWWWFSLSSKHACCCTNTEIFWSNRLGIPGDPLSKWHLLKMSLTRCHYTFPLIQKKLTILSWSLCPWTSLSTLLCPYCSVFHRLFLWMQMKAKCLRKNTWYRVTSMDIPSVLVTCQFLWQNMVPRQLIKGSVYLWVMIPEGWVYHHRGRE